MKLHYPPAQFGIQSLPNNGNRNDIRMSSATRPQKSAQAKKIFSVTVIEPFPGHVAYD
jgi:hypothetical protein